MSSPENAMPVHHQVVLERFVTACKTDQRIVAAFLGGSYARGEADSYSDLDLYVITTDEAFQVLPRLRREIVDRLGEPLFVDDFDIPDFLFFILSDGIEGELGFVSESVFRNIQSGPYQVLVDKKGILAGVVFPDRLAGLSEQTEKLRRQIFWFWHDLSHFITAIGRGQLWWAQGQLEVLRRCCVNLARFRQNLLDLNVGDDPYFKLDEAVPVEGLAVLQATFPPFEPKALLNSGLGILRFYQELARPLADAHGIKYPYALEGLMVQRLENLRESINFQVNEEEGQDPSVA